MKFLIKELIAIVKRRLRTGGIVFFNTINDHTFREDETIRLIQTMTYEFNIGTERFIFPENGVLKLHVRLSR
jgi:hypothetical protein